MLFLLMFLGNHKGRVEDWFLGIIALLILGGLVGDYLLRKRGWKPKN